MAPINDAWIVRLPRTFYPPPQETVRPQKKCPFRRGSARNANAHPDQMEYSYITLIGSGTIGLSFAALHLARTPEASITIYDPRPDLLSHVHSLLPGYLSSVGTISVADCLESGRLKLAASLEEACTQKTSVVQEQGPENEPFKVGLWPQVESFVSPSCLLWSSTSGIPASVQSQGMESPGRLVVVHPFNPPHIMPLLEIVPGPATPASAIEAPLQYFKHIGHSPVVVQREKIGFVANRLAFALLREACSLVADDVVSAKDLDTIVENSVGPRWCVKGPLASYHDGGGKDGLGGFFENIGRTIESVWEDSSASPVEFGKGDWKEKVVNQTMDAYGVVTKENFAGRDRITKAVLEAVRAEKQGNAQSSNRK